MPIRGNPAFWTWLVPILLLALALRVATALGLPTIQRPDEVYQTLEPAHRLVYGWGIVSWEWRDGIRSWFFPGVLASLVAIARPLFSDPDAYLSAIPVVLSAVSVIIVAGGFVLGWRLYGLPGAILTGVACAVWPDLVIFGPKSLTEIQAAPFLTVAAILASIMPGRRQDRTARRAMGLTIGLCLGVVVCLRFQLAPAVAMVGLWALARSSRRGAIIVIAGCLVPLLLQGLLDDLSLGSPFQSIWKNYLVNVMHDKAASYGTDHPLAYVANLVSTWSLAIVPVAATFAIGLRRAPLLAITAATIVVSHSMVAHKEGSFIYAAIPLIIIVAGLGSAEMGQALSTLLNRSIRSPVVLAAIVMLWIVVAAVASPTVIKQPLQNEASTLLESFSVVRTRPDLCGLALYRSGVRWYETGGYAVLNRPVPISIIEDTDTRASITEANYLIYNLEQTAPPAGWDTVTCTHQFCVAHRNQLCLPNPETAINTVLERRGE